MPSKKSKKSVLSTQIESKEDNENLNMSRRLFMKASAAGSCGGGHRLVYKAEACDDSECSIIR